MHAIAAVQKIGGQAAFIDVEHSLDPSYAESLGINIDNMLLSQPDSGEQALEIADALFRTEAIDILIVDSVAALVPKAEIEGEMGESHVVLQARLMSQAMRKLSGAISRSNIIVIFIIQLREKVGLTFSNPEVTPGGRALKFYSTIRLDVRQLDVVKAGNEIIGNRIRIKVVKNKVAPPFKQVDVDLMYGEGISREGTLLDYGVAVALLKKVELGFYIMVSGLVREEITPNYS